MEQLLCNPANHSCPHYDIDFGHFAAIAFHERPYVPKTLFTMTPIDCILRTKKRKKVKTGCLTCKTRKIKCDESRPICLKCRSTGRICDGYGVWGGGETVYSQQQRLAASREVVTVSRPPVEIFLPGSSVEEKNGFEWFRCRTAPKIPGSFMSSFWSTLLFQAGFGEPAVLHAVLALSSVHKGGHSIRGFCSPDPEGAALQHYVSAMKNLRAQFATNSKSSSRVALIACIVFINLELLRGHFQTALTHFDNGIRILQDAQLILEGSGSVFRNTASCGSTECSIVQAFARMQLQLELFRYGYDHRLLLIELSEWSGCLDSPVQFASITHAWEALARLLNQVFHLSHLSRQQSTCSQSLGDFPEICQRQNTIKQGLRGWINIFKASSDFWTRLTPSDSEKVCQLLMAYHTLANIMVDTAVSPNYESAYDFHTKEFHQLLEQLTALHIASGLSVGLKKRPGQLLDMEHSITDMGWIPLLYYTAIKCRIRVIRRRALDLLKVRSHREGMWDARTMACVARKVIDLEETDFYNDIDAATLDNHESERSDAIPLPDARRLREIEVVLSGAPMETIMLFCKREDHGVRHRVLLSTYHVQSQGWIDS